MLKKDHVFNAFMNVSYILIIAFAALVIAIIVRPDESNRLQQLINTMKDLVIYVLGVLSGLLLPENRLRQRGK